MLFSTGPTSNHPSKAALMFSREEEKICRSSKEISMGIDFLQAEVSEVRKISRRDRHILRFGSSIAVKIFRQLPLYDN